MAKVVTQSTIEGLVDSANALVGLNFVHHRIEEYLAKQGNCHWFMDVNGVQHEIVDVSYVARLNGYHFILRVTTSTSDDELVCFTGDMDDMTALFIYDDGLGEKEVSESHE